MRAFYKNVSLLYKILRAGNNKRRKLIIFI